MTPPADRSWQLVASLHFGEPAAVADLLATYCGCALRLCDRHHGTPADAQEIVQGVLWPVVQTIDTFTGGSAFNSWLYSVVANVANAGADGGLLQLQSSRAESTLRQGEAQVGMRALPYHKARKDHVWTPFDCLLDT